MAQLDTRRPTGRPSHPCVLLEGDEKAGKSWAAAAFTGDPRFGRKLWIDLAEGDADWYGDVPGADFEIMNHDGTYAGIYRAVSDAHAEAKRAHEAGELPMLLTVDPIDALWRMLSEWANNRAAKSRANRKLLDDDPNAEINVGPTYWNPAGDRWRRIMTLLLTFPGVVLVLARGKETSVIGPGGNPVPGAKDYRVEGHKSLCFDVTAWVRFTRNGAPRIIGGRSTKVDMRQGKYRGDAEQPNFSLGWLIFDVLGYDPATARTREGMELKAGSDAPTSDMVPVLTLAIESAEVLDQLKAAHARIGVAREADEITVPEATALYALVDEHKPRFGVIVAPRMIDGHALVGSAAS